jgi:hypothetical protein
MFAKSRFLEVIGGGVSIPQQRHEWISLAAPVLTVTEENDAGGDEVEDGASQTILNVATGTGANVMEGTLLVNSSRATPIGTYQRNEILQVTGVSTDALTVVRDIGAFNSGTGSTAHTAADVYRILYTPHQEGSAASYDPNTYSADTILENYSSIDALKMQLTGSQMARAMEVVDSEVERQWSRELNRIKNELVSKYLYGFNSATAVGSDTVIRNSKGLLDFCVDNIVAANPLVDYTTTTLTSTALNTLFKRLWDNGADPSEPYKIVCAGNSKQTIGGWDADLVRTERLDTGVGREITVFKSDMGFEAEIIAEPTVQKNDLFIVNAQKIIPFWFRPWDEQEWGKGTSSPNGDDMWYKRSLSESGLMVIDPGYAHAAFTYLTW